MKSELKELRRDYSAKDIELLFKSAENAKVIQILELKGKKIALIIQEGETHAR